MNAYEGMLARFAVSRADAAEMLRALGSGSLSRAIAAGDVAALDFLGSLTQQWRSSSVRYAIGWLTSTGQRELVGAFGVASTGTALYSTAAGSTGPPPASGPPPVPVGSPGIGALGLLVAGWFFLRGR